MSDPLYSLDLQQYLTTFISTFAQHPAFPVFIPHLNPHEREVLQGIGVVCWAVCLAPEVLKFAVLTSIFFSACLANDNEKINARTLNYERLDNSGNLDDIEDTSKFCYPVNDCFSQLISFEKKEDWNQLFLIWYALMNTKNYKVNCFPCWRYYLRICVINTLYQ